MNEADPLLVGLAGGAIGALLAALFAQAGRALTAWGEVSLHDEEAAERNRLLLVWVDDRTREVLMEMDTLTNQFAAKGQLYSGALGGVLAHAKAKALHEYRDQEWLARLELARLRAKEGGWHSWWRLWRRRRAPRLTEETLQNIEPFLDRWRETVTHHGGEATPLDRTRRTTADALEELPSLKLT